MLSLIIGMFFGFIFMWTMIDVIVHMEDEKGEFEKHHIEFDKYLQSIGYGTEEF